MWTYLKSLPQDHTEIYIWVIDIRIENELGLTQLQKTFEEGIIVQHKSL